MVGTWAGWLTLAHVLLASSKNGSDGGRALAIGKDAGVGEEQMAERVGRFHGE